MVRIAKIMVLLGVLAMCGSVWAVEVNEPVSHWKFDEGSGTIAYDSAGDNDGTIYGAQWTTGQIDGALSFDGVNDYVDCGTGPAITGTGDFAVSAWVKVTELPVSGTLVVVNQRSTTSPNGSYRISVSSSGYVHFEVYNGGYGFRFYSDVSVGDGSWHHIVEVRTSTTEGKIYIDGNLAGSGSGPAKSLNNVDVVIGRWNGGDLYFNGLIDDVRIYERALSAEEIWQLYQAAPVACVVGGDQAIEAGSGCEARVTLDGSCSSDADSTPGTNDDINDFDWYLVDACDPNFEDFLGSGEIIECNLPLGEHVIVLEVTDKADAFDTNEVTIIVEDTTPPEFTLSVATDVLWPPNHKMIEIGLSWVVSDNCDESPDVSLVSITIEGDDAQANDDVQVDPNDGSIYLRAKRSRASGRVYIITYQAADDSGNVTVNSTTVTVPHNRRRR